MNVDLNLYISIINDFLNKKISSKCFEYIYLELFLTGEGKPSSEEYEVLNGLFMDVEAFCNDPSLIDEDDIGEAELRLSCEGYLEKLKLINEKK